MAEMWTRSPIMQGNSEQQQLTLISQLCGTICPQVWPGVENLELYKKMELPVQKRKVKLLNFIILWYNFSAHC
jgi:cyclin-dependent kinase 9